MKLLQTKGISRMIGGVVCVNDRKLVSHQFINIFLYMLMQIHEHACISTYLSVWAYIHCIQRHACLNSSHIPFLNKFISYTHRSLCLIKTVLFAFLLLDYSTYHDYFQYHSFSCRSHNSSFLHNCIKPFCVYRPHFSGDR